MDCRVCHPLPAIPCGCPNIWCKKEGTECKQHPKYVPPAKHNPKYEAFLVSPMKFACLASSIPGWVTGQHLTQAQFERGYQRCKADAFLRTEAGQAALDARVKEVLELNAINDAEWKRTHP